MQCPNGAERMPPLQKHAVTHGTYFPEAEADMANGQPRDRRPLGYGAGRVSR